MRILVTLCTIALLAACCSAPTSSQQHEFQRLRADYDTASDKVEAICAVRVCDDVLTARYNAAAALTEAAGDPSNCNIDAVRKAVQTFVASEQP